MKTIEYKITVELPDDSSTLLPNALNDGFVYNVEKWGLKCCIEMSEVQSDDPADEKEIQDDIDARLSELLEPEEFYDNYDENDPEEWM